MAKVQGQLEDAQLENRTSDPTAGKAGRMHWDTSTTQMKIDDATNIRAILRNDLKAIIGNNGTAANNVRFHRAANAVLQIVLASDTTAEGSYGSFGQLAVKIENFTTAGRPAAGNAGRAIYNSDNSTIEVDNGSAWESLLTLDNAQVVTNKDVDGGTASNTSRITIPKATKATLDGLTRKQGTLLFASDESILYIDDGTTLVPVGSGSSGINYIDNSDAAAGVSLWNTYADAAGTSPVDGTGGSANITLTRTTSSPLRGSGSFLITKDAVNRQGEGVSTDFTIDNADKSKILSVSFDYEVASGTFVVGDSSDLKVFLYDVTNSVLITPNNTTIPGNPGKFQCTFSTTSATSYRLIIHVATTSASAWTFKFDNVQVGPQSIVYGPAMTDWKADTTIVTPSAGFGTVSAPNYFWRRVGDTLHVRGYWQTGTVAASTASIDLPSGYTIDTTKYTNTPNGQMVGRWHQLDAASGNVYSNNLAGVIFFDGSDSNTLFLTDNLGTTTKQYDKQNGSATFVTGQVVDFEFSVSISGWSTNVVAANSSSFLISSYLVNGTRVTTTPTALGEYRARSKTTVTSNTYADNAATTTPSSANGIKLDSANYASAQTAGDISLYNIFVGKNKVVKLEWYRTTGRTGEAYPDYFVANSTDAHGVNWGYDPTSGVVTIDAGTNTLTSNTARLAVRDSTNTGYSTAYFDILVSENALSVQQEALRSEVWVYTTNGYGSSATMIRRWTTVGKNTGTAITLTQDSITGDKFTINSDGVYAITFIDQFNTSQDMGISLNSSQLTTGIASITATDRIADVQTAGANLPANCQVTLALRAGDVIRAHTAGAVSGSATQAPMFRIVKVSN